MAKAIFIIHWPIVTMYQDLPPEGKPKYFSGAYTSVPMIEINMPTVRMSFLLTYFDNLGMKCKKSI